MTKGKSSPLKIGVIPCGSKSEGKRKGFSIDFLDFIYYAVYFDICLIFILFLFLLIFYNLLIY